MDKSQKCVLSSFACAIFGMMIVFAGVPLDSVENISKLLLILLGIIMIGPVSTFFLLSAKDHDFSKKAEISKKPAA